MSIRLRLTLWYSGILTIILIVFGMTLYTFLSFSFYSDVKSNLKKQAQKISNEIYVVGLTPSNFVVHLPTLDFLQSYQFYIQVIDSTNQIYTSSNLRSEHLPVNHIFNKVKQEGGFYETATVGKVEMMVYDTPIYVKSKVIGALQVAMPIEHIKDSLDKVTPILFFTGMLAIILSATIGWFLASKALRPIDQIISETEQIEKGIDLDRRISHGGTEDEIGRLTTKINGMLSRLQIVYSELEESYRAQRRFVSDASHELRTPLTTIRGNVELLKKMWSQMKQTEKETDLELWKVSFEAMQDIASEAERMTRLVNDLLALARADAGHQVEREQIEVKPLLEEVHRKAQFLAKEVEWRIGNLDTIDYVFIFGNKDYLQQLIFIFLENAFKYTSEGFVSLDVTRTEQQIGIKIQDTGIGMDKEEVPHIFERFYRADISRGQTIGTGLGLSIAKWIIDEHEGSIEVITKKQEGTAFIIWLPISFQSRE